MYKLILSLKLFSIVQYCVLCLDEFQFVDYEDQSWVSEWKSNMLYDLPYWKNEYFTTAAARCSAVCSEYDNIPNESIIFKINRRLCTTFPMILLDGETTAEKSIKFNKKQAELTMPCFFFIGPSKIPGAGRGVFSRVDLKKGVVFEAYKGVIENLSRDNDRSWDRSYAWKIFKENETSEDHDFYVDGIDENNSNWLRYINSARFEEEQNIFTTMLRDNLYYMTFKNIRAGEELLVWYGKEYAHTLGIDIKEGEQFDWTKDIAPPKAIVKCDTCDDSYS